MMRTTLLIRLLRENPTSIRHRYELRYLHFVM